MTDTVLVLLTLVVAGLRCLMAPRLDLPTAQGSYEAFAHLFVGGLFGAWMLVSVFVGRPAQLTLGRTIAEVKRGAEGADAWAGRWDTDARFRRGLRINTAAWGAVLLGSAVVHIVLVYTLPIDLIALVTNVAWFGALALLIAWHVWYLRKENLDA